MGLKPKTLKLESSPNIWMSTASGNVYEFADKNNSRTKPQEQRYGRHKVVKWGTDNLLPYHNRQLLADNDIKQNLINTDVDITCGKGLVFYQLTDDNEDGRKEVKFIRDVELEDWRDEWMLNELYSETVQDVKEFGNSWVEFLLSRDKTKCNSMVSLDAVDCRFEVPDQQNRRRDADTLLLADWKYQSLREEYIQTVPLINFFRPELGEFQKCALHVKINYSGQPYYTLAEWHGTRPWTEVSNLIPKFHRSGLKGGYALRYHIKIPITYLEERVGEMKKDGKTEPEAVKEVKKDIQEMFDDVVGGAENAQKAFYSWINDHIPKPIGWTIEKIETDLKDDSYITLSDAADKKHARGHNLHPVLAGIETSGSLSSGSEILNLLNYHVAYKTSRIRRTAMRPINLVMKMNFPDKWKKGIRIGVEDVELTTLDANPKGQQEVMQNGS